MECPFKVGDKIKGAGKFAPVATVTKIDEEGCHYIYEPPYEAHPRLNITYTGGIIYPRGYKYYRLATDDDSKKPVPFLFCTAY